MYKNFIPSLLLITVFASPALYADTEFTRAEIFVNSPDTVASYDCEGRNVTVRGPDSRLTLKGNCPVVNVIAPDCTIHVVAVNKIQISGPNSKVYYKRSLHPSRFVQVKSFGPNSAAYQVR
ncbi:DUF3060 domain-containing protein [Acinetobacter pragensis]|uniref:DUF3060 domain-containing protein n=1 Tax=Acinetobacter pragensis TaxID=1806892 RepID=UPI00333E37A3